MIDNKVLEQKMFEMADELSIIFKDLAVRTNHLTDDELDQLFRSLRDVEDGVNDIRQVLVKEFRNRE